MPLSPLLHEFHVKSLDHPSAGDLVIVSTSRGEALLQARELLPGERLAVVGREPMWTDNNPLSPHHE